MGTPLNNLPAAHVDDQIRSPDGRDPVRNQNGSPPGHKPAQLGQDFFFSFRIHTGKGVVQDQKGRVFDNGPGQGRTLLLPSRQSDAALPEQCIVLAGQFADRGQDLGDARGLFYFLKGGIGPTEDDVLPDRIGEKEDILGNEPDRLFEPGKRDPGNVGAVNKNRAGGRLEKPEQQINQGAFPRARIADDAARGAGGDGQRDVFEVRGCR
jgi:hypothetical protein